MKEALFTSSVVDTLLESLAPNASQVSKLIFYHRTVLAENGSFQGRRYLLILR
jgi:hypothetical protein